MGHEIVPLSVKRLICFDGAGSLKAFCDVTYGGVLIKGVRIVEGKHGVFVSMPRMQGKDARWYDTIVPLTKATSEQFTAVLLAAYRKEKS